MTPTAIIAELDACTTREQIEAVASKHRKAVMALKEMEPARFHHVANKKRHMLKWMEE